MTKKAFKFTKDPVIVNLGRHDLHTSDEVSWEIDTTDAGEVVSKSTDPNFSFTVLADPGPPKKHKKTPDHQFLYTMKHITGAATYDVPYTVYLVNGSWTPVATGYLVIDTIGMGHPKPCKDDDEGDEHGKADHGHRGRD